MTLNDLENTMVVRMRNKELYLVLTDVRLPVNGDDKYTMFVSKCGFMHSGCYTDNMLVKNSVYEIGHSNWDIMEVYKRVYSKDVSFRRGDHHRGPNSIETMLDPDNLCRIWSREEELEALSHTEIERDETIKQLDEFGSKEVTFY
ncbi:MAG: hypothetical protein [Bacteriophage sp.]|nr:MAG: hypothetical protein [Bacteriophage sp.]